MFEINMVNNYDAFHILMVIVCGYIVININHILINIYYIIDSLHYMINMNDNGFWVLILHILIAYIILISLKIEIEFRATIKFNL